MHWGELPDGVNLGEVFAGRYRLDSIIGSGAMGVVAAGHDLQLAIPVAIKFLVAADPERELVRRFIAEARAVAQIDDEHVVRVFNVASHDEHVPYIVMERLEGRDVATALRQVGCFPVEEAVDYLRQACKGVGKAHRKGIIHRDLKPANLFLVDREDERPLLKVLDFGVAKLPARGDVADGRDSSLRSGGTEPKTMLGSPFYMPPEQMLSSGDVDRGCDIWALGVTLYELVMGEVPYRGDHTLQIYLRVTGAGEHPWRAKLRERAPQLMPIVTRCLDVDVKRRYPDVAALAQDLARVAPAPRRTSDARIPVASAPPASQETAATPGALYPSTPPAGLPAPSQVVTGPVESRLQALSWAPAAVVALVGVAVIGILLRTRSPLPQVVDLVPAPAPVGPTPAPTFETSTERTPLPAPPPPPQPPPFPAEPARHNEVVVSRPVQHAPAKPVPTVSGTPSAPVATSAPATIPMPARPPPGEAPVGEEASVKPPMDLTKLTRVEIERILRERVGTPAVASAHAFRGDPPPTRP